MSAGEERKGAGTQGRKERDGAPGRGSRGASERLHDLCSSAPLRFYLTKLRSLRQCDSLGGDPRPKIAPWTDAGGAVRVKISLGLGRSI